MTDTLHVTSGDSAAGVLRAGLRLPGEAVLVHRDVLSCGPLPPIDDLATWLAARQRFWDAIYVDEGMGGGSGGDPACDLALQLARLGGAETVTVWLGRALSDQLLLAWLVRIARTIQFDVRKLRVVQWMVQPATGWLVRGMGELAPGAIAAHPTPAPLSLAAIEELRNAWDAVTAPQPERLLDLLAAAPVSSTLAPALTRLLDRYPHVSSGLARWDMKILEQVAYSTPRIVRVIGETLAATVDDLDCVGDLFLMNRLRRLAGGEQPLLAVRGPFSLDGGSIALTDAGREVLAGRASQLTLNGVDDWVGGVHLQSAVGPVWFRHGATLMRSVP